jgi:glycosyltransferase involved in cell wall biosynthesis
MRILSVVIPAYNEEDGIAPILERILKVKRAVQKSPGAIEDVEVIVVNDASQDRTCDIASSYPDVTVITHRQNKGYGGALKTGFAAAKGEWVGFLDADGTYPPEEFPALCEAMVSQDADMVIGSRMTGGKSGMPIRRYIGNKFFAYLLSWIVGSAITDTASGQRVFKRKILAQLLPLPDGLHLTPAMSTAALHEGLNIIEVPIRYDNRVGQSKLHIVSDGFRFLNIIIRTARLYNPLKFFGVVGLVLLAVGCFLSVEPITYYLDVRRVEDTGIYRLVTIMVLFVTGINVMVFGAFANHILEIVRGKTLAQSSLLGKYVLNRRTIERSGLLGTILMVGAVSLNYQALYEYITSGYIFVHWVYVLTGATLFLVGLQLLMGSILVGILQEINERQNFGAS